MKYKIFGPVIVDCAWVSDHGIDRMEFDGFKVQFEGFPGWRFAVHRGLSGGWRVSDIYSGWTLQNGEDKDTPEGACEVAFLKLKSKAFRMPI